MPLDFPASPSTGQTFTGPNGVIWQFDGAKWVAGTAAGAYAPIVSPAFTGNPTAPTPPAGDADTSLATTAFVAASTATALTNVGRNLLHNSMFNVAQRGNGPFTVSGYTLDRWNLILTLDTGSVQRDALAPGGMPLDETAAYQFNCFTTGNAAAGSSTVLIQPIEDLRRLAGKTVTVSFYAAASVAGAKFGVSIDQNFGSGGTSPPPSPQAFGVGQSVALTTSWARYSLTFAVPSIVGKTLGTNGDSRTALFLWLSAGSAAASRSGGVPVQTGTTYLWGVQLEVGSTATPLEKLDPVTQLQQCQRFYCAGGAASYGGAVNGAVLRVPVALPVTMRAVPATVTSNFTTSGGITSPTVLAYNLNVVELAGTQNTTSYSIDCTFTASADL